MNSLINPDNYLLLWTFIILAASTAIYIEQNCRWSAKIPGAVIALLIAMVASNTNIIPLDSPVYDAVWGYIVPLAIPLLLFQLDLYAILKESKRLFFLFLISSVGTMLGAIIGFMVLKPYIPELDKVSAMIAASYTGGGVNFAAMTAKLEPSKSITAATIVADNLMMACYFLILIGLVNISMVKRIWGYHSHHPNEQSNHHNAAANYWKAKPISLQNIALSLATSMVLVAISFNLSSFLKQLIGSGNNILTDILISLITDKYLLLTSLTFLTILCLPKKITKLEGSQELGTYCIYLFFVVIGIPASIPLILANTPLLFIFTLSVALTNLVITLIAGKIFKYTIEEIVLCCNANIGGPTTAAALAIGQGWRNMVGPILIIGTIGYIIGNYIGTIIYTIVTYLL